MEKQFNREDELIKRLLNDAGTETPSAGLKSRIMLRVEAKNTVIKPYKPLISMKGWIGIVSIMTLSIAGLSYMVSEISFSYNLDIHIPQMLEMPEIDLSRTMQIAFAFVALFFLQIPFLNRYLDREYRF